MFEPLLPYLAYWSTGALFTILLTAIAFPAAVAVGLSAALGAFESRSFPAKLISVYISIFRGLPEVLVIFIVFFGSSIALQRLKLMTGIGIPNINPSVAAFIALTVQFGAYASVIFTDWLKVFPHGLVEAGAAVGMTRAQIRRRIFVPLLLRSAMPALGNLILVMVKVSALASLIGMEELSRRTTIIAGSIREPLLCYSGASLIYLAITIVITAFQRRMEMRLRTGG